jgi:hypothetical protein
VASEQQPSAETRERDTIRVDPPPEPAYFEEEIRAPGTGWLAQNPNASRPPALWSRCLPDLAQAFANRCAYAAMYDSTGGTLDHYRSFKNYPHLAYEWGNYRFASQKMNSCKRNADDKVLDPYEIGDGWFEILLPSLQMSVSNTVPQEHRERAEYTLRRLKLRDGEEMIRWRSGWYQMYRSGGMPLDLLRAVAPLIAEAVVRQGEN